MAKAVRTVPWCGVSKRPKKPTIRGWEKALKDVPEDERFGLANAIRRQFEEAFAKGEMPGKPVLRLPSGTSTCPLCGGLLDDYGFKEALGGHLVECDPCDQSFLTDSGRSGRR